MPEPSLYLEAMGAAAVVSAICVLAMAGGRRPASTTRLNSACVVGIVLGLVAGYDALSFRWAWPTRHGLDRLLTIVVPMVLGMELIAGFQCVPRRAAWCLRLVLAAVTPTILIYGSLYVSGTDRVWTLWQAIAALALCSALLAGVWGLLAWLSARSPGVSIPLALVLTIQCAGLAVMLAGYIKGGAAAIPLAATLAATALCARLKEKTTVVPTVLGIGVVGLFGLLFIGRFFGRLSTASALAMLFAPLFCWATEVSFLRRRKPWLVGSLRLVLVAIPLVAVLTFAKRNFNRDMAPLLGQRDTRLAQPTRVPGSVRVGRADIEGGR